MCAWLVQLLAWALLCGPLHNLPVPEAAFALPGLAGAVYRLALADELTGPLEEQEVGAWPLCHLAEWRSLRRELAGAPHLSDLSRFPPYEVCDSNWRAADAFLSHCYRRAELGRCEYGPWHDAAAEARPLCAAWSELDDATGPQMTVASRRRALANLRELLGPADYFAGRMPPAVPHWLFTRID